MYPPSVHGCEQQHAAVPPRSSASRAIATSTDSHMRSSPRRVSNLARRRVPRVTVAIATPFTEQGGVDEDGIARTVVWLQAQGIASIIPGGTTGEFAAMMASERLQVLEATRRAAGDNCFLFANVSACAVGDALTLARQATASLAKPDALLLLPPYYHQPFSAGTGAYGCKQFFRSVLQGLGAAAITTPVYMYTFAVHTQQPIPPATFGELFAEFPQLAGIKASAVGVGQAQAYAAAAPGATVLVGNGRENCASLRAGLNVVSGDCVAVSWALVKMLRLVEASDVAGAEAAQQALVDHWRVAAMDRFDEVPAVKAAFSTNDAVATLPAVRPPLVALDASDTQSIRDAVVRLRQAIDAIPLRIPLRLTPAKPPPHRRPTP
jgi:4-hydroxy-tetrahydrodipicolinate synthase